MKTLFTVATTLAVLCALLLSACAGTQPIPPTPPQPTDVFDGIVADCSQASADAPIDRVRTCLDVSNTAECLAAMFPANTLDTIACTVRALTMSLHVELARTGGNAQMQAEASAADAWIRAKRIGYR